MKKILVTGFGPFGGIETNPSQLLVDEIRDRVQVMTTLDVHTEILPVVYEDSINRIQELIQEITPDILLSFGVAAKREKVYLERVALNLKDASIPDNTGIQPIGELIYRNAPLAYLSNLPLLEIRKYLADAEIPIVISNHAGAYICNAVFYAAANLINSCDYSIKYGFIHIPLIGNDSGEAGKLNITKLVEAILGMLDWL